MIEPVIPRFLNRKQAAAWAGVSVPVFSAEVAKGKWPAGEPRGAKGGKLVWDRMKLEAVANRRAGMGGQIDDYEMVRARAAARRERDAEAQSRRKR